MWRAFVLTIAVAAASVTRPAAQTRANQWQDLDAQATDLYARGDLPHAIEAAQSALRIAESPGQTGRSLDRLGFLYYTAGNLPEGEKYLRQSLDTRDKAFGTDSLEYAETVNDLAMLLRDLRKLDEARSFAQRAVDIRTRLLDANDVRRAESLNVLGTVFGFAGDYASAVQNFERALAIHELRSADDRATEEYGTLCVNLAGTYQRLGKYTRAETTFKKGLDALRVRPGVTHPAYAVSLLAYAALQVDLGRFVDAERSYEEGGRLAKEELGETHPVYAAFLNNRGFLYQSIGNAAAAASDYQRSLDLKRQLYGPNSPQAASTLRNLAHLTYSRDRAAGERLLAEAVALYAKAASPPPFDYASVLLGLARAERERGDTAVARINAARAQAVASAGLGTEHPLYAAAVRELGTIDAALGDDAAAEHHLREAIDIAEDIHGSTHPDLPAFLDPLAAVYASEGKYAAALDLYRRSFEIQDRYLSDVLEIGAESFKTATVASYHDPIPALIAFQATAGGVMPDARTLAFEAVTRRKGRVLDQIRGWRERLSASPSADVRRRVAEWQALLECRTSLTVALGYHDLKPSVVGACGLEGTDLEGRYERLLGDLRTRYTKELAAQAVRAVADLRQRGDAIEAALNRTSGGGPAASASMDDVRRSLAADELLVEFVSYAAESNRDRQSARRYGAFIVDAAGGVRWVDVGAAAAVDSSVRDLMDAANDWSISTRNKEDHAAAASAATAQDAIGALSRLVWTPVQTAIGRSPGVRRLRIAPDALLDLVPFEALGDGLPMIDRYAVSYTPSGRDMAAAPLRDDRLEPPAIVVSPGAASGRSAARDPDARFRADGLAPLPAAPLEAADVRRVVPTSRLYASADATEHHVKGFRHPAFVHIVGHGVIRGGDASAPGDAPSNAMTQSAIVLEEAYGRGAGSPDDGLLTAAELENVDLRGTEMVVLSQCQMASGLASIGEGVYGMRRAAAIAGARSFVAPLWNVDDGVERRLMARFYRALAAGEDRRDALRRAKLSVKADPSTRSFLYWAPVILSGASGPLPAALFQR